MTLKGKTDGGEAIRLKGKFEPKTAAAGLRGVMGPLMRQVRKFEAFQAFLAALPDEVQGLAAPHEIRLVGGQDGLPSTDQAPDSAAARHTLLVWCAAPTVALLLDQRARLLVAQVNGRLAYPLIEDIRCETVGAQRVQRQLQALATAPD